MNDSKKSEGFLEQTRKVASSIVDGVAAIPEKMRIHTRFGTTVTREATAQDNGVLEEVKTLCQKMGLPFCPLWIVESSVPQGFADPNTGKIFLSKVVLSYPPEERIALIAHELAHVEQYKQAGKMGFMLYQSRFESEADERAATLTSPKAMADVLEHVEKDQEKLLPEVIKDFSDLVPESVKQMGRAIATGHESTQTRVDHLRRWQKAQDHGH
jgi:Zn-dependent protease with chaperone function